MRGHVEGYGPEVDASVGVDAGDDGEDSGSLGSSLPEATQPEDDRALVLGHDLEVASKPIS